MIAAIDTETGGAGELECTTHALLSIGAAVDLQDGTRRTFHTYVLPDPGIMGLIISDGAVAVNGYSPDLWREKEAVSEREALQRLINWIIRWWVNRGEWAADQKVALVAHNAGHDRGFLTAAIDRCGLRDEWESLVSRRWRCSCALLGALQDAGRLSAEHGASLDNLTALRTGTDIETVKARRGIHTADMDAIQCLDGYHWMLGLLKSSPH